MEYKVELVIPAKQPMMLVVRMTTAGMLSRAGLMLDTLEDLKMVAEEACLCMMMQKLSYETLHLEFENAVDFVSLTVSGVGFIKNEDVIEEPYARDVMRTVLESMLDKVEIEGDDNQIRRIRMIKEIDRTNYKGA